MKKSLPTRSTANRRLLVKKNNWLITSIGILALAFFAALAHTGRFATADTGTGSVSLTTTGVAVTETFNTLSNTAGSTTNTTLPTGWYITESGSGARDNEQYAVDTGGSNTGDTFSYGAAGNTDRALGGLQSGTLIPLIGARVINNTGVTITSLGIAYTGEQWRIGNTAAARDDRLDFQYSLDATDLTTGTWTDVNTLDFVNPIKTAGTAGALDGNAAANRTAINNTISSLSIPNGATFFIRFTDLNASGADDGLSVDDFSLTPNPSGGPPTPTLNVNDVTLAEGDAPGGTTTFTFTVSLTAPAGPGGVTFDIATADGTAQDDNPMAEDNDYVAQSLTGQTIPAGSSTYAFNVLVNHNIVPEPNETFFVNVTNITGANAGDTQGQGTIQNDDVTLTPIHDIQGPGASSPIVGSSVTTRGIVTGVRSNGFFIQEPDATVDADPATSEGILVFGAPPPAAVVGALVQVTGTVAEFVPSQDPLQPPLTELTGATVVQISTGNPLPVAIPLTATFPDPAGPHDQLERLEGMRTSVASLTVVGPTLGNVNEANATATSTGVFFGVVTGVPRPFREAGIQAPDPPPSGGGTIPPIPRFDSNPERIRVDSDGLVGGPLIDVGTGAVVTGLVGPLDYTFRTYTILPDPGASIGVMGGPMAVAVTDPTTPEFTVASYNLERFFDTVNDPGIGEPVLTAAAFDKRLNKASLGIRNFLKFPDIIGVVEVENLTTLQALAARISADAIANSQPDPEYDAYLVEGNDVGGIDVGFLVKTSDVTAGTPRVTVIEVQQELDGTLFVNPDSSTETLNDRPPLRLNATVNFADGAAFPVTVIVNHLRSLNDSNSEGPGSNGWPTDGARVRAKRQKQAEDLANLVQARQTANPAERIILVGDFNAFEVNDGLGDSMGVIQGTPVPDNETAVPGDGVDLVNPDLDNIFDTAPPTERYSFVFDGNAQSLDHILINQPLIASTSARRVEHPRINADFPETARNDGTTATRLADHDPVVGFFRLLQPCVVTCPANITVSNDMNQCGAVVNYDAPTSSGDCGTVTCSPASGSFFPVGTTTVNCSDQPAGDTRNRPAGAEPGNSCSFTITVNDTENPTITCPANITVEGKSSGPAGATVNYPPPTVNDNCPPVEKSKQKAVPAGEMPPPLTPVCTPPSGSFFNAGTTTVNCTVMDAAGNSANCSFTVTVNAACTITCPANITQSNAPNQCGAVVNYPAPTPAGECAGATTCTPPSGSFFPVGTTTVTCTANPDGARPVQCTFTVTVNDTQPPTITCPANITAIGTPGQPGAVVNYPAPTAADNCPGVTTACVPPSGSTLPVGTTTVTCTATDGAGNTATCSFTVSVFDICLQDDSNANTVVLVNSQTGDYRFCCAGTIYTGKGTVTKLGNNYTITHNPADRRVTIKFNGGISPPSGSASLQSPVGTPRCTITDRDTRNNTCNCGGAAPSISK